MQPIHCNSVFWSECSVMVVSVFHITSQIHHPHWIRWSEWTSAVKKNERRSPSLCHQCNWQSQTEIVWISDLWLNIYFWWWLDYLHQVDVTLSHSHTTIQHLLFGMLRWNNLDVLCFWCCWCFCKRWDHLDILWTPTLCLVWCDKDIGCDEERPILCRRNHVVCLVPNSVKPAIFKMLWFSYQLHFFLKIIKFP